MNILQKHFKKDHVHMRLWTRFYGMALIANLESGIKAILTWDLGVHLEVASWIAYRVT